MAVDPWPSGLASALGEDRRHLVACSRRPEKEGCDQAFPSEIAEDPNGCLVRRVVADWFAGSFPGVAVERPQPPTTLF